MEDSLSSIFNYHESCQLRQKLLETTVELENMRNVNSDLLNLLKVAYQERDEAREQIQKLVKKLLPPTSNVFVDAPPESLVMLPTATTKANSSITESNSPSHVSSPVDSLLEGVSSPEFSNMNVVDSSHKLGYLNQRLVQHLCGSSPLTCDLGTAVIDHLAKGKVLPQKGTLLQAVIDAGPLLQTLLVAGPLPSWRNPPPLQAIKVPPLTVKDFGSNPNACNSFKKPILSSSHSSQPSMPNNISGITSASPNNACHLTSIPNCKAPPRIRQSHQYFL